MEKQRQEQMVFEANEMNVEIKLLKVDTQALNKQLMTETEIIDKKLTN